MIGCIHMNHVRKIICITAVIVGVGCSTAVASESSMTTEPHDSNASTLPTNVPSGSTSTTDPSVDTSELENKMERNENVYLFSPQDQPFYGQGKTTNKKKTRKQRAKEKRRKALAKKKRIEKKKALIETAEKRQDQQD